MVVRLMVMVLVVEKVNVLVKELLLFQVTLVQDEVVPVPRTQEELQRRVKTSASPLRTQILKRRLLVTIFVW